MTARLAVDHAIFDHPCRWSRTGRENACLDDCKIEPSPTRRSPRGVDPMIAIGLAAPILSLDLTEPCSDRHRSDIAAPPRTTKSP